MDIFDRLAVLATQEYTGCKPGLERIRAALLELGNPHEHYAVIHITGTNGKGSVAAILHAILVEAGYKVGLYTSPHFLDCRERMRVNHELIPKATFARLLKLVFATHAAAELTYFELLTTIAFVYFAEQNVDLLVCEVGLGGRYDATNIVPHKLVNIITSIDLDHKEYLGNNLKSIAQEKAGILQPQVPLIVNTGHSSADKQLKLICVQTPCQSLFLGRDFKIEVANVPPLQEVEFRKRSNTDWLQLEQSWSYHGIKQDYVDLRMRLLGLHQINNAALALATIEMLSNRYPVSSLAIYTGLRQAYWPGRFEVQSWQINNRALTCILDGAHNAAGIDALLSTLRSSPYAHNKLIFVISILKDKDYKYICKALSPLAKKIIIFRVPSARALPTDILKYECLRYLSERKIFIIDELKQLSQILTKHDNIICVTGSLYAVNEAIRYAYNSIEVV